MQVRTTAILGAGAVLDFNFEGIEKPTTANITKICTELEIQALESGNCKLIKQIYDIITVVDKKEYERRHPFIKNYNSNLSFEDLFEIIETLYSYNCTWNHEHYPISLISALVRSDIHFESIEYYRALIAIAKTIIGIVEAYNNKFIKKDSELWYKHFWKRFDKQIDVFNFNYDTTIEYSLEQYNDGFIPFTPKYKRFDPKNLWDNDDNDPTVNHLHGCILYADTNPQPTEFHYSHRDLYKFYSVADVQDIIGHQWMPHNQVGDSFFYTPIITGLKKTDKICYMPQNIYHANLVKKIIENPSLLICGYSFGDLYANQILERHKLIHDKNQKVIIIDKWPNSVNEDSISLYRYYMDNTTPGFKGFVARIIECGICPLDTFKQFVHIQEHCWLSPNGTLMLFTNGMQHAIMNNQDEILNFLQKRPPLSSHVVSTKKS